MNMSNSKHPPAVMGRKSKFNDQVVEKICTGISAGLPQQYAAALAGISHDTFHVWQRKYPKFRQAVETALSRGLAFRLKIIQDGASSKDENVRLRAATWWLEHVFPQHFARNRIEVTGPDGLSLSAGVQLYLPKKDETFVETGELLTITEGGRDENPK